MKQCSVLNKILSRILKLSIGNRDKVKLPQATFVVITRWEPQKNKRMRFGDLLNGWATNSKLGMKVGLKNWSLSYLTAKTV